MEEVFLDSIQTAPPPSGPFGNVRTDSIPPSISAQLDFTCLAVTHKIVHLQGTVYFADRGWGGYVAI